MNENKLLGLAWISPYIIGLIVFTGFSLCFIFLSQFYRVRLDEPAGI
ncbi:ABC sugar transporter [Klebsiella pneumoniae]|uniref:ABC sugar transporter n=1 Tax=Klebsiella pneumoniae TaxID=573 RepID=A0A377U246_KLEPN|nr:ABC sugar transporter [Klebsiella pneumoniae]